MTETLEERYQRVAATQLKTRIVSADDFRVDDHGVYGHEGDMGLIAWRMAERSLQALLPTCSRVIALAGTPGAGKTTWLRQHATPAPAGTVFMDITLTRRKARRELCAIVNAAGKPIRCLVLHPTLETCLRRNQQRGRQVPEVLIRQAHHRLCVCPPDFDEGWDAISFLDLGGGSLELPADPPEKFA